MPLVEQLVLGILPALGVALVAFGAAWGIRRPSAGRSGTERLGLRGLAGTVALSAGFLGSYVALQGWPPLPPITGTQALALGVVLAGVVGIPPWRPLGGAVVSLAVAASVAVAMSRRLWGGYWDGVEGLAHVAAAAAGMLALDLGLAHPAGRRAGLLPSLALALVCCGGGFVLSAGGSALLGQLESALAAVLAAGCAAAVWNRDYRPGRGAVRVFAIAHGGSLAAGWWFAEVDPAALACLAAAPLAVRLDRLVAAPARVRGALVLLVCLGLVALAAARVAGGGPGY